MATTLIGDPQPAPAAPRRGRPSPNKCAEPDQPPQPIDVLVQSGPGQFLQMQIELTADGVRTPVVERIRLRYPRESWLEYMPAIFSEPDEQRAFLERYLAIAQATWDGIDDAVGTFERYLDPASVPAGSLEYLASWLDLPLEGTFSARQNRLVLQAMPTLWRDWGTVDGLRAWVRVHLAALSGHSVVEIERIGLPGIVECFVDRRRVFLNRAEALCAADALWSEAVERRFQVGVFDREGEVALVSPGDPALDVFRRYAHSFRVLVPAAWVPTPEAEALLRRAIDLQRPAHTRFELVLVEPRLRVGDQSTIGLDTVIGGDNIWRLPGPAQSGGSRGTRARVGIETIVGGRQLGGGDGAVLA